jgi:hypothetical protein
MSERRKGKGTQPKTEDHKQKMKEARMRYLKSIEEKND